MPLKLHPLISFSKLYRHIRLHSYLPIKLISISCILFDFSTKPKIYQPLLLTQSRYSLCQLELNQNEWNKRKKKLRNQKKKSKKKWKWEKRKEKKDFSMKPTLTIDSRGELLKSDLPNEFSRRFSHFHKRGTLSHFTRYSAARYNSLAWRNMCG